MKIYNFLGLAMIGLMTSCNTDLKGTILCIGNGGCEFSMRNEDGSADKSAHPKNNTCQDNILTMAKNALEYLKTR